jgi:acyl-coenzyme A thioesterase PaaI-like protein
VKSTIMSDQPLDERRRAAQCMRELTREITTSDATDAEFVAVADAVASMRDRLARHPRIALGVDGLHTKDHAAARSGREPAYDRDPLIGRSNPLAPPLARVGEPEAHTWEVTFGDAYGGHPGFVHGGYVAAVLDHVLGVAASSSGVAAMTGTLTTRFRRPTPLNQRLVCVGRIDRVEGRKVFCSAGLDAGDTRVAEAEGVYLRVDPDRY